MNSINEDDLKYDIKRRLIVVIIVAVALLLVFIFWPLIYDWILGRGEEIPPSERLHDGILFIYYYLRL